MTKKLEATHTLRARVSIEIVDENDEPVAVVRGKRPVGAGDDADVVANVERFAAQVVYGLFAELAKARAGSLIVLDIIAAERRLAVASFLLAKADELVGKTLYHPELSLRGWAEDICKTPDYYTQCQKAADELRALSERVPDMMHAEMVDRLCAIADQLFVSSATAPKE